MVKAIRRSYLGVFAVLAAMALLCVLAGTSGAATGDNILVSVDNSGAQATGGHSKAPSISTDAIRSADAL